MSSIARLRTLVLVVLVSQWALGTASASPTVGSYFYTTYAEINNQGPSSQGPISFDPVVSASPLLVPGSFSLGQFQTQALASGASITYGNVPVDVFVEFYRQQGDGSRAYSGEYEIKGFLNGTLTGSNQSDVLASISSIQWIPHLDAPQPPAVLSSLHVDAPQILAPSDVNGGLTTLTGRFDPVPVPEPASWAVFALVLGVGFSRLRRGR